MSPPDNYETGRESEGENARPVFSPMPNRSAPRTLQRRLLAIADEGIDHWAWWRRGALLACLPLALVVANLGEREVEPGMPDAAQIEQGRRDLALALSYLNRVGEKANVHIVSTLDSSMVDEVTERTVRTLSVQLVLEEETTL